MNIDNHIEAHYRTHAAQIAIKSGEDAVQEAYLKLLEWVRENDIQELDPYVLHMDILAGAAAAQKREERARQHNYHTAAEAAAAQNQPDPNPDPELRHIISRARERMFTNREVNEAWILSMYFNMDMNVQDIMRRSGFSRKKVRHAINKFIQEMADEKADALAAG